MSDDEWIWAHEKRVGGIGSWIRYQIPDTQRHCQTVTGSASMLFLVVVIGHIFWRPFVPVGGCIVFLLAAQFAHCRDSRPICRHTDTARIVMRRASRPRISTFFCSPRAPRAQIRSCSLAGCCHTTSNVSNDTSECYLSRCLREVEGKQARWLILRSHISASYPAKRFLMVSLHTLLAPVAYRAFEVCWRELMVQYPRLKTLGMQRLQLCSLLLAYVGLLALPQYLPRPATTLAWTHS